MRRGCILTSVVRGRSWFGFVGGGHRQDPSEEATAHHHTVVPRRLAWRSWWRQPST